MKITICGSIAHIDQMVKAKEMLEQQAHEVLMPLTHVQDENGNKINAKEIYERRKSAKEDESWIWERKHEAMQLHFKKIRESDAILVLNYPKHNTPHYIGGNTLMEIGVTMDHGKRIYLLNPIPEVPYKEEILGSRPVILYGDFTKIQ